MNTLLKNTLTINLIDTLKTAVMFCVLLGFGSIPSIFNVKGVDALTLGSIILLMVVNKSYMMSAKLFGVTIGVIAISLLNMFLTNSPITEYFSVFGRLIAMGLLITAFKNDYQDIAKHFAQALSIVVGLALVNFVLYMSVKGLYMPAKAVSGFPTKTIGLLFNYFSTFEINGIRIPRNQGMFWEPGVLQIPVNILIYYRLLEQNKPLKSVLVPIFVLLTTVSTTGFMIFAVTVLFKFKSMFSLHGKGLLRTLGMVIVIGAFGPILYFEIDRKLNNPGDNVSSLARTYDMLMSAQIALEYPVMGIGINPERNKALMKQQTVEVKGFETEIRGNTNTILQFFVNFGVSISLVLIIALYRQRLFSHRLAFFIIIMLAFFSEPLIGVFLMILLMLSSVELQQPIQQQINH